jgi:hypothetical protein
MSRGREPLVEYHGRLVAERYADTVRREAARVTLTPDQCAQVAAILDSSRARRAREALRRKERS